MAKCSSLKIMMLYEAEIATTQLIERVLSNHLFEYKKQNINEFFFDTAKQGNYLPLIIRGVEPRTVQLVNFYIRLSLPFVFYIDDNFWEINDNSALSKYYQNSIIKTGLKYIVSHASLVLCNSMALSEYIKRNFTERVSVVPPMFDFSLVNGIEKYTGAEVRIGFAGSLTRKKDIQFLTEVIPSILDKYDSVVFEFAGVMPDGVVPSERVRYFAPVSSYADFIKFQYSRGWQIGLAPLLGSASDNYKTNNKFREYSACHTAGIYSNNLSYQDSLQDKVNGLICDTLSISEWLSAISLLLDNPQLRHNLSGAAHKFVKDNYDVQIISSTWHKTLYDASKVAPKKEAKIAPVINKLQRFTWQIFLYKLRIVDVYKNRGAFGLLKHTFLFLSKRIMHI